VSTVNSSGNKFLRLSVLAWLTLELFGPGPSALARSKHDALLSLRKRPNQEDLIQSMLEREHEAASKFLGYQALRTFEAENSRFNLRARLVVKTKVESDGRAESKTVSFEGSELIRKHVFDKILEAEQEAGQQRKEVDIVPDNYYFSFEGLKNWGGRENYVFAITPIRKSKYAIDGRIWLDCNDLEITRIVGSPAKRPSFWTTTVKIEKDYCKQGDAWVPARLISESEILLAGKSKLDIEYDYSPKTGR
jgi:hypothetical protein